jgi:transcriptional regulator with XRE-family HTH domain
MLDISERLKTLRKSHNYTIQTLAERAGIAVRTYQNYEYGQREISTEALFKLADFYGVTTDYLLGRDSDADTPDTLDKLAVEFNMTLLEKKIVDNYLSLPKSMRGELMEFLRKSVQEVQAENGD